MSAVADVVDGMVAALVAAGVPATAEPDLLPQLVAAHSAAALVMPPAVEHRTLSGAMRLLADVHLVGAPPGGRAQLAPVWDHLGAAMGALTVGDATVTPLTLGGVTFPGYLLAAHPRTT